MTGPTFERQVTMASYDPLLDLKDASFSDDRKDASFSDDRNRPMLHEVATAVGDHLHRFADAGAWLDANYDPATVTRRHLRESMDWQLLEEARRTPLSTTKGANASSGTREERRNFRRVRIQSLRDIKARWSNNRGRFLTAWLDVIHDLAERPLDERTEDDASTTARRLLLLTWILADPNADSRKPVVTELQNWPWERLSDDDAAVSSRGAVRLELFGGPEQSGPKPRPVQGLGVLREGWQWARTNLRTLFQGANDTANTARGQGAQNGEAAHGGVTWQQVQARYENMVRNAGKWIPVATAAKELGCHRRTCTKARDNSSDLQKMEAQYTSKRKHDASNRVRGAGSSQLEAGELADIRARSGGDAAAAGELDSIEDLTADPKVAREYAEKYPNDPEVQEWARAQGVRISDD